MPAVDENLDLIADFSQLPKPVMLVLPNKTAPYRRLGEWLRTPDFFVPVPAVVITAIATLWAPTAGKKVRFMGGQISVSAQGSVLFEDNAAGAGNFVWRTPVLPANTPYEFDLPGNGKLLALVNNILKGTLSVAGSVTGTLYGTEE